MGNFTFKKKFGQNFLSDKNLLNEIVAKAGVTAEDVVVEIGAGKGALTEAISAVAKKVYSFEVDKELFEFLTEKFDGTNVEFVFKDVMDISDKELHEIVGEKFKLVANLPYYITSPILTRFLQNEYLESATVMVQEEVADRIIAGPRTKDYGVLTVMCQLLGETKKVLRVNRKMFYPVPNVDSAVVRINKYKYKEEINYDKLIGFVKKSFTMRRKKLSANLETNRFSKQAIEEVLVENGYLATTRAEELSIEDFKRLYWVFLDIIG